MLPRVETDVIAKYIAWKRSKKGNLWRRLLCGGNVTVFRRGPTDYRISIYTDRWGMRYVTEKFLTEWKATEYVKLHLRKMLRGKMEHALSKRQFRDDEL